jgi:hypothetical protein
LALFPNISKNKIKTQKFTKKTVLRLFFPASLVFSDKVVIVNEAEPSGNKVIRGQSKKKLLQGSMEKGNHYTGKEDLPFV